MDIKHYINQFELILNPDRDSKRKTIWIAIRITNLILAIELALYTAEKAGYIFSGDSFTLDLLIEAFTSYAVLLATFFFCLIFFAIKLTVLILSHVPAFAHYMASPNQADKIKFNEMLKNGKESEAYLAQKDYADRRYKRYKESEPLFRTSFRFVLTMALVYSYIVPAKFHALFVLDLKYFLFLLTLIVAYANIEFSRRLYDESDLAEYYAKGQEVEVKKIGKPRQVLRWIGVIIFGAFSLFWIIQLFRF